MDSKRYGRPGREVRPEREAVLEGGPHPCCTAHMCADTFPCGLWVQTPLPVDADCCVRGWPVTSDQHAGNGADIAVASPADALEACSVESVRLGIKYPSHRRERRNPQLKKDINLQETLNHNFHATTLPLLKRPSTLTPV